MNSEVLATQFQEMGQSVTLVTWTAARGDRNFSFRVVRNPSFSNLVSLHRRADVVFENNPCLRLSWPSVFFGSVRVVALRTWVARNDGKIGWQDKLKMRWLKSVDAVIAVSNSVAHSGPEDTHIIGNPYRRNLFRITNPKRDNLSFVFMGRLVSFKGCFIALEAFSKIFQKKQLAGEQLPILTIIGDGELRQELENRAVQLNVSKGVKFTGILQGEELVTELNNNAYLLMPSLVEAFGNVSIEAMACGCLPIVSDNGGLPDAIGKAGLVVKNSNAENYYEAITQLLENPEFEKKLRAEASRHLENHTPEVVARRYMNVILNAVKKH